MFTSAATAMVGAEGLHTEPPGKEQGLESGNRGAHA